MNPLRAWAVRNAFGSGPLPLFDAVAQLGFVQADPIRSPARAQDLILRQRVPDYRAGDLEAAYPSSLDLEEDFLYAYGFLPRSTWSLLHPRKCGAMKPLERRVHKLVLELGEAHPSAVAGHLGGRRAVNDWGGYSAASTRALHWLHWFGMLRVARRENGTRVYMPPRPNDAPPAPEAERLRRALILVARIFAPMPEASLREILGHLRYCHLPTERTRPVLAALLKSGELVRREVDGMEYVWPAGFDDQAQPDVAERVRILAPFDPLVWDRRRFEHLWGWAYRFEAYTPAPKRKLGYYAMPLLWRDRVVGWVNAAMNAGALEVEAGFVTGKPPRERGFRRAFEEEVESLKSSLALAGPQSSVRSSR